MGRPGRGGGRGRGVNPAGRPFLAVLVWTATAVASPAHADVDVYWAAELGGNIAPAVRLRSGDTDRAARCDEFVNPRYAEIDACVNPDRGIGAVDDWQSRFNRAGGVFGGVAAGLRRGRARVELALSQRAANYDQAAAILHPNGEAFTAIFGAELPTAEERIGGLRTRDLFANAFWHFPNESRFTPFVGAGIGVADARMDYRALWRRSDDPATVRTAAGLPNEEQVRRNLAGTVSRAADRLRDTLRGYQLLFGVEYAWKPKRSLAVQARWARFGAFEAGGEYDQLRSHVSNLRRDGSEPVIYRVRNDDTTFIAVSLRLTRG